MEQSLSTITEQPNTVAVNDTNSIKMREEFVKRLDEKPTKIDKAQGFDTLPISALEHELDEIYMGIWKTDNFRYQVIANEIVGTINLHVFDPTLKTWLTRSGSAAVMIRQKSGADITDIGAKQKNALVMDFPKLETMCLKKAAKSLGKRFGRDLNRKFEDDYNELYTNEIEFNAILEPLTNAVNECNTMEELLKIWNDNKDMQSNSNFKKVFSSRKLKLNL